MDRCGTYFIMSGPRWDISFVLSAIAGNCGRDTLEVVFSLLEVSWSTRRVSWSTIVILLDLERNELVKGDRF